MWMDSIRMNFEEIVVDTKNWIDSAQDECYWRAIVIVALYIRVS